MPDTYATCSISVIKQSRLVRTLLLFRLRKRAAWPKAEVKKALDELKRQLGEKVIDVEPDRVELLEADQDGAIQH